MKRGDIFIVKNELQTGGLNGLPPGQRVILREVFFHTPEKGKMLGVELIGKPDKLYHIYECFPKTTQEVRDEKISQIVGLPPEEIQK